MSDQRNTDAFAPMTDGDITAPPVGTEFTPAAPLKDTGVSFEGEQSGGDEGGTLNGGRLAGAKQTLAENTTKVRDQATDKARVYAEDGKAKATGALDQLAKMLTDAAGQVDDKVGAQYGQYARSAADQVQSLSSSINDKSVDELFDDVRELVRKSPGVAIGAAAALGFVVARLLTAGIDQRPDTRG